MRVLGVSFVGPLRSDLLAQAWPHFLDFRIQDSTMPRMPAYILEQRRVNLDLADPLLRVPPDTDEFTHKCWELILTELQDCYTICKG